MKIVIDPKDIRKFNPVFDSMRQDAAFRKRVVPLNKKKAYSRKNFKLED